MNGLHCGLGQCDAAVCSNHVACCRRNDDKKHQSTTHHKHDQTSTSTSGSMRLIVATVAVGVLLLGIATRHCVSCSSSSNLPFSVSVTNGTFLVSSVALSTPHPSWAPRETVSVVMAGNIPTTQILAGQVSWRIFDASSKQMCSNSSTPYFHCDSQGCNPAAPISLLLQHPTSVPTPFSLKFHFVLPPLPCGGTNSALKDTAREEGQGDATVYHVELLGQDQRHTPADFSAHIEITVGT